jgi:hypothetical protein
MQLIVLNSERLRLKRRCHAMFLIAVFCIGALYSTGCAMKKQGSKDVNRQINVFDVHLFSSYNNIVINGVPPRREPCIKRYELYYDFLDIIVSYTNNNLIWRITTRNKKTNMFGIYPGDSFSQAKEKILQLGFVKADTPYKFLKDWCLFTLLVNENNEVFGMTVETLD